MSDRAVTLKRPVCAVMYGHFCGPYTQYLLPGKVARSTLRKMFERERLVFEARRKARGQL